MNDYKLREAPISNSIRFFNGTNTDERNEVLRISKDGVWANPDVPADEAAQLVLKAIDAHVKGMVLQAVKAEREACAEVCEKHGVVDTHKVFANLIRARGNP